MREKQRIRDSVLSNLKRQRREERDRRSLKIKKKLFLLSEFSKAKTVMFYISRPEEVDTWGIIRGALKRGKKVVVPITNVVLRRLETSRLLNLDRDLVRGPYRIYEPEKSCRRLVPINQIDLVVVPGVAFDEQGNRLGRGKGYYDKFLRLIPRQVPVIGLAFSFQLLENLPHTSRDIPASKVLSDKDTLTGTSRPS